MHPKGKNTPVDRVLVGWPIWPAYRIRHNQRPWARKKQTDSKPHENEAKNSRPFGALIVRGRPFRTIGAPVAPIARRPLIVLRPLIGLSSYFCVFTYVHSLLQKYEQVYRKKQEGIVLHVQRKVLVQENKNCMVYKWVSIALVFPIEFRDFFAFTMIEILPTTGHKKKQ